MSWDRFCELGVFAVRVQGLRIENALGGRDSSTIVVALG